MNHGQQVKELLQALQAIALLLFLFIAFIFLRYWFSTFYTGSWQQFKEWYPHSYFIVFPLVKILPVAGLGAFFYFLRKKFFSLGKVMLAILSLDFSAGRTVKTAVWKALPGVAILIVTLAICLYIAERFLLKKGFKPGYREYSIYFHEVDSVYDIHGFTADSNGIFCVSKEARAYICGQLAEKNSVKEITPYTKYESPEIYSLAEDYLELRDTAYQSTFKSFLEKINTHPDTSETEVEEAIKQYASCPVNSSGFRSIEFKKYRTKKKSVLLLGDSFTWGHSASNATRGFADLLLAKGYVVYNTGISGADPAQYLKFSEILIPLLQPDFVVVNFFLGNDVQYFKREPQPFMPIFYSTNAGNILSCPDGVYLQSPKEAYDYTYASFTVPQESWFNKQCAKTAFGTLLWRVFAQLDLVDLRLKKYNEHTKKVKSLTTRKPYSNEQVRQIRNIAQQYGTKFFLISIPKFEGRKFFYPDKFKGLFEGIDYLTPPAIPEQYNHRDGHYNDLGHEMHAGFLDSLMSKPASAAQ